MFLPEIFLPLLFFSPVSQEMPDGAGAWTNPSLQNYPLKRPPALTPSFASSPAVKRMSLAMPRLRRQASLQTTAAVLQTRGGSEPLPGPPFFRNRMPGFANWGLGFRSPHWHNTWQRTTIPSNPALGFGGTSSVWRWGEDRSSLWKHDLVQSRVTRGGGSATPVV